MSCDESYGYWIYMGFWEIYIIVIFLLTDKLLVCDLCDEILRVIERNIGSINTRELTRLYGWKHGFASIPPHGKSQIHTIYR